MRVRLPLNGFRFFEGNWVFHVAFLIGSHFAVPLKYSQLTWVYKKQYTDADDKINLWMDWKLADANFVTLRNDLLSLIFYSRFVHVVLLITQAIGRWMKSTQNEIYHQFTEAGAIMLNLGFFLFYNYFTFKFYSEREKYRADGHSGDLTAH